MNAQPAGGWGSAPPPAPKKKGMVLPLVLGGVMVMFGGCASYCGYEIYKGQTPEGKRETKARDEKEAAEVDAFLAKLGRIRSTLPKEGTDTLACPSGTSAKLEPVVDTLFLQSLLDKDDAQKAAHLRTSELLRSSRFSTSILDGATARAGGDAGAFGFLAVGQATVDIDLIDEHAFVVVLRVDDVSLPSIENRAFSPGTLVGSAIVVNWKNEKVTCYAPVNAASSPSIDYGGGVQVKVVGLPVTVGSTELIDAANKDFAKNVDAAVKASLAGAGAS